MLKYDGSFHCVRCNKTLGYAAAMKKKVACKKCKPWVDTIQPELDLPNTVQHIETSTHGHLAILTHK